MSESVIILLPAFIFNGCKLLDKPSKSRLPIDVESKHLLVIFHILHHIFKHNHNERQLERFFLIKSFVEFLTSIRVSFSHRSSANSMC